MANNALVILDLAVGTGPGFETGDSLDVNYVLTIGGFEEEGGRVIDATRNRGTHFTFRYDTGAVIKGWDQGVTDMRVGGKRRLVIPSHLGYGSAGVNQVIPPDCTLYFEIELLRCSQA